MPELLGLLVVLLVLFTAGVILTGYAVSGKVWGGLVLIVLFAATRWTSMGEVAGGLLLLTGVIVTGLVAVMIRALQEHRGSNGRALSFWLGILLLAITFPMVR